MSEGKMSLNEMALVFSFVFAQIFVALATFFVFASMPANSMKIFSGMPPLGIIYSAGGYEWMTHVRHMIHGVVAICSIVLGLLVAMIGMKSHDMVLKFIAVLTSIQMVSAGLLNSAEVIILQNGGIIHLISVAIGLSVMLSSILITLMVIMKYKHIKELSSKT